MNCCRIVTTSNSLSLEPYLLQLKKKITRVGITKDLFFSSFFLYYLFFWLDDSGTVVMWNFQGSFRKSTLKIRDESMALTKVQRENIMT